MKMHLLFFSFLKILGLFFFLQRATESVFTCILDSISSEHGVTCTASYKDTVIETYSPNLRSISTASLDPRQCKMLTCVLILIHN